MASSVDSLWTYAQRIDCPCEESMRTKISRAYYALYHRAKEFHDALPTPGRELAGARGVHQRLIHQLTNPTVADAALATRSRTIGTMLLMARERRVRADYETAETVDSKDLNACLRFVEKGFVA